MDRSRLGDRGVADAPSSTLRIDGPQFQAIRLGALIFLIVDGGGMAERQVKDMQAAQQAQENYIRNVAGSGGSAADELENLAKLRDSGTITAEEFAAQKAKILA